MLDALESEKKNGYITVPESQATSIMLIVAGTDTTSNSMTYTAFLLAKHPKVQERLLEELVKAMPDKKSTLRFALIPIASPTNKICASTHTHLALSQI
jgi:cytochrome P450